MLFLHTGQSITLEDVILTYEDFKTYEPEYVGLPKGVTERRYSEEGHFLIRAKSDPESLGTTWEEGNKYLKNRYIYQARTSAKLNKTSAPGVARISHTLALVEVLLIRDLEQRLSAYENLSFEPTVEELWKALRQTRNELLSQCDYTQLADSPLTEEQRTAWALYRQQLRDITLIEDGDPLKVEWPTQPA